MSRDILNYFEREVAWFKRSLSSFAEANPRAAANLKIGENLVEDPHVSRLIESVALLNSRIHARLDDDFPLVLQAFLEHLYPFYLAPKPSMTIAQLEGTSGNDAVVNIPVGTSFETERSQGTTCRFQSCYATELSPIKIALATLRSKPFSTPGSDRVRGANAVLELKFETTSDDFNLGEGELDHIILHIKNRSHAWRIYDLLYAQCLKIVIAKSDLDPNPTELSAQNIKPMGSGPQENILPDIGETASVYQQLMEFFAYPEKHLFFRISGLKDALEQCDTSFSCYIYLKETNTDLEKSLDTSSLALHCTPVVNLFTTLAEPVRIDSRTEEHLVTPDIRAVGDMEVYAIEEVQLIEDGSATSINVPAYYSVEHSSSPDRIYWHGSRRSSINQSGRRRGVTEYHLSLSLLDKSQAALERQTLQIKCRCSNGNLPSHLPFGGGSPHLTPENPISGLRGASSLTAPTPARRIDLKDGLLWRLLSHLNLNYLSLVGGGDAGGQLREMLRLYDFGDSPVTSAIVDSVDSVRTTVTSLPIIVDGRPVVCRGIDFAVTFDVSILEAGSALLLGHTLQRFLSMYVSINSFVRVTAYIKGREGIYYQWEPEVGGRLLL